ncbi:3-hydroxyacyl-CoA dehydrogenase NAD-binding domain-containing protein [Priestia megaterium]|jgi:3-hydroxybutyryl-CoA dehydrogenase|uniref:3-hydroxyacyl-CoA dehydrogenase family protein n=1 Tax=Priestia megaterium TaxID=1404 RepID=UPI000E2FBCC6|nr:3-hydroxyacyl-CoA dehydrogenase NAD-binding domain-containing protein [Priestia megaterium]RFB32841.1 3-hydroxyacyl-CoA dehydrogenase family protein [Bacillus sp. RC]MBW0933806.1 3-hydroxyacyl-CoA dehydrogenase family protein [Priestia megaterium]MCA4158256.1 3-hydroxyacyl-CoA dehydrogenase family protein [Priestia megaterium]MDR7207060.1 3-hydroxybutyryl-CoA dehydrogenase [Priestia megaterium]MED3928679.1 3-hydroxyacyl-CoA dehydrogenase NAD-binding domain-containing protein [Priestia megat
MSVSKEELAIIGSGTMGHSIALSASIAGFNVKIWGIDDSDIQRGKHGIDEKLNLLTTYEVVNSNEIKNIKERIYFTNSLRECVNNASFVIEGIPENLYLKQKMFQELDELCSPNVILASNTSGLSPTDIAALTSYPERTVVTHFWNPGHLIPLVEVIRGEQTSKETVNQSLELLKHMNKKPIVVQKDILGSIGNRLQYALFREAQYILEQGVASIEDIDKAVCYSIGRRLSVTGPFMTADMGGLDVFDSISTYLFPDLSNHNKSFSKMKNLIDEGNYGQKTGKGFYEWSQQQSKKMNKEREQQLIYWLKKDLEEEKE